MKENPKFNGKAMGRHINMPDIDRDYRWHIQSRCPDIIRT